MEAYEKAERIERDEWTDVPPNTVRIDEQERRVHFWVQLTEHLRVFVTAWLTRRLEVELEVLIYDDRPRVLADRIVKDCLADEWGMELFGLHKEPWRVYHPYDRIAQALTKAMQSMAKAPEVWERQLLHLSEDES